MVPQSVQDTVKEAWDNGAKNTLSLPVVKDWYKNLSP